ncbi:MAG: toprim domain-containing protein [Cetobacterium sp.]
MNRREEIKMLIEDVEKYTLQYSAEMGVSLDSNGFVSCLSPTHPDKDPSCSWWEENNVFHCFGCGEVFNIFKMAHIYEGKPMSGPNFINENLFYLAERYGLKFEHLQRDLTPEEIEEQQYFRTMELFEEYVVRNKNEEYLSSRSILPETATKLKIGSVKSFSDCMTFLDSCKCSKEIVKNIGIDSFKVNENKMIFIIKDEWGRATSFVSREMNASKNAPKYINGNKTVIFDKSKIFYGWSDIKKEFSNIASVSQLVIVEGYIDFVSSFQRGLRNIVALGSASFTDDQINIIEKDRKIKKVAFALDHDAVGVKRTESIMERIKKHSPTAKQYNFAIYKEVGKDVDEILKNPEIKKLSQIFNFMSLFEFELHTIRENIGDDVDESQLFDRFVGIIAQSTKAKEREEQARALSKYLNDYSFKTVLDSVSEIVEGKQKFYNDEIKKRSMLAVREIEKSPKSAGLIVEGLKEDLEFIASKYDVKQQTAREKSLSHYNIIEEDKTKEDCFVVDFKFPWLDDLDIMPGNSIIISSLANTGK